MWNMRMNIGGGQNGKDAPKKESKYIAKLVQTAKARQLERDSELEKKRQLQRKEEDSIYGEKGKYISESFRKKQDAERANELQQRSVDDQREQTSYSSNEGNMTSFYSNILRERDSSSEQLERESSLRKEKAIKAVASVDIHQEDEDQKAGNKSAEIMNGNAKEERIATDASVPTVPKIEIDPNAPQWETRNDKESISAYQERYFHRKEMGLIGQRARTDFKLNV